MSGHYAPVSTYHSRVGWAKICTRTDEVLCTGHGAPLTIDDLLAQGVSDPNELVLKLNRTSIRENGSYMRYYREVYCYNTKTKGYEWVASGSKDLTHSVS